jgi:hypothetical protein
MVSAVYGEYSVPFLKKGRVFRNLLQERGAKVFLRPSAEVEYHLAFFDRKQRHVLEAFRELWVVVCMEDVHDSFRRKVPFERLNLFLIKTPGSEKVAANICRALRIVADTTVVQIHCSQLLHQALAPPKLASQALEELVSDVVHRHAKDERDELLGLLLPIPGDEVRLLPNVLDSALVPTRPMSGFARIVVLAACVPKIGEVSTAHDGTNVVLDSSIVFRCVCRRKRGDVTIVGGSAITNIRVCVQACS